MTLTSFCDECKSCPKSGNVCGRGRLCRGRRSWTGRLALYENEVMKMKSSPLDDRLSTPKPRKPQKKPQKKLPILTTTTSGRQLGTTADRRVPFVVVEAGEEDAVVQRPKLLQARPVQ